MAVSEEPVRGTERAVVSPLRAALLTAFPLAAAIGVFGVIFGSTASVQFGPGMTIAMSLLVFSGTVQFATVALLMGGAGVAAVLLTVVALNARNLVLGAVLRQRIEGSSVHRAALAWFMVDESFGLAVASPRAVASVLLASGVLFYLAWQAGTLLGVLGATVVGLEGIAEAVFPLLFIGLAAITAVGRGGAVRALVAVVLVIGLAILVPDLHPFAPIVAAVLVALPGGRS